MAVMLKAALRGGKVANDPAGKIAAALKRDSIKFGIVMDDKIITVDMPWSTVRETDEAGISEWIVEHMRGGQHTTQ
jgi:hypothetical protein